MAKSESFYQRLTRIFRSEPAIQRRIKGYDYRNYYNTQTQQGALGFKAPSPMGFGRENSPFSSMGESGLLDRMARYSDFAAMEYSPEIASTLDVYSHEIVGGDDRGKSFHVYSNNPEIKKALDELFYDVLNVEFNLPPWTRNLCKFGDFFLFNEVIPDIGIINVAPIPVSELEREEGFDPTDPHAVRFKWLTRGNQYLENWQVTHMRILGNDSFLPYGHSVLESSRRIWRTLQMMEDAMLVYRVIRAPDRRVFYIDVANVAPNDVAAYMEAAKTALRSTTMTEHMHGRGDQRHNPLSIDEDFFIAVRGTESGTKIDTLAGGTNATATEDIEYIQKKLFAALKVPKPYLNYDENTGAKATLAQEDVRFSRTIATLQKIVIAELNKLAMIHLFSKGFDGEDLVNFELKLSNPSTIALQQRLEIWTTKTDVATAMKESGLLDETWIKKNILELTDEDIIESNQKRIEDKIREVELEAIEAQERVEQQIRTVDEFDPTNYQMPGENVPKLPMPDDEGMSMVDGSETAEELLNKIKSYDQDGDPYFINFDGSKAPLKANARSSWADKQYNKSRRMGTVGRDNLANPDFSGMLSSKNRSLKDLYDKRFLDNPFNEEINIHSVRKPPLITGEMRSIFSKLKPMLGKNDPVSKILTEQFGSDSDDDQELSLLNESVFVDTSEDDDSGILLENFTLSEDEKEEDFSDFDEIISKD